uniref:Uncharacterized protein LOC104219414 n=1 Tax=Nicotiana sylvestris TaxID=4096 RepID=A0A1U7VPT1_NICSY|nr:PREDICTED: uncharacterized protein LOC104219414 [Nicotiana sylvestris]
MSGYAKFIKALVTKKRSMNFESINVTHQVSAIVHSMAPKLEDPSAFTISCTIGSAEFAKAFVVLRIGKPRTSSMKLKMADHTMKKPLGEIEDVLVRVDKFIISVEFVILDCKVDYKVSAILRRHFLATGKAYCDVEAGELTFRVGDEHVVFHVCKSMRQPNSNEVCSFVDLMTDVIFDCTSATINVGDMLEAILLNFDDGETDSFMECVNSLQGMGSYNYATQKLSLELENSKTPPTKPSIEEPPTMELNTLPPNTRHEFLGPCSTLLVILSSCLINVQVDSTVAILQKRKKAFGRTLVNIRGLSLAFCMNKNKLEDGD